MKILNRDTFKSKKYLVFVTTYCGLDYFKNWSRVLRNSDNIQLIGIDSGNQEVAKDITDFPIYQTSQNIGCAGCWNFALNLGFNLYGVDKIIIGQDDAMFDEQIVEHIWNETNDDWLVGAYDRGFTYSLFGITKEFWNVVGFFDENFLYGTYEDNDYIHRIRILGKNWKSLNYSADLNSSLSSRTLGSNIREINKNYMIEKWGHFEGVYTNPFNDPTIAANEGRLHTNLTQTYGDINTFPSFLEFEKLL